MPSPYVNWFGNQDRARTQNNTEVQTRRYITFTLCCRGQHTGFRTHDSSNALCYYACRHLIFPCIWFFNICGYLFPVGYPEEHGLPLGGHLLPRPS